MPHFSFQMTAAALVRYLHPKSNGIYLKYPSLLQVIPIVTQLKESLTKISDDDQGSLEDVWKCYNVFLGVKTFKKDLLASIERRLGEVERLDHFALATALDPRCWSFSESNWVILDLCRYFLSSFSKPENGERAREVLIQKLKDALISIPEEEVATETTVNENETWAQMSKRRKVERQEQVIHLT